MNEQVRSALRVDASTPMEERTIDITTVGRRTGEQRRIEIVFHGLGDGIYLSGLPRPRPRSWLLNIEADPHIIFHLKRDPIADLPAIAAVIADPAERRRVLTELVNGFNQRHGSEGRYPTAVLDEWLRGSPLARVSFEEPIDAAGLEAVRA